MAFRRRSMGRKESRRKFARGAVRVQRRNVAPPPMRGGIRL